MTINKYIVNSYDVQVECEVDPLLIVSKEAFSAELKIETQIWGKPEANEHITITNKPMLEHLHFLIGQVLGK